MIWFVSGPSGCGKTFYIQTNLKQVTHFVCSTEDELNLRMIQRKRCIVIDSLETYEDSPNSLIKVIKKLSAYESKDPKNLTVIFVFQDLFDLPTALTKTLRDISKKKQVKSVVIPRPSKATLIRLVETAIKTKLNIKQQEIVGSFQTFSNLILFLQTFGKDFSAIDSGTVSVDTSVVPFEAIRQRWFDASSQVCSNLDHSEMILWSWWNFISNVNSSQIAARFASFKKDPVLYELYACCKSSEMFSFVDILPFDISDYSSTLDVLAMAAPRYFVKKLCLHREKTIVKAPDFRFVYLNYKPNRATYDTVRFKEL